MKRVTLEEFVWENWSSELLDSLETQDREIIQYYFGLEPYRPHTIAATARWLGKPYVSTYRRIRTILKNLKNEILKSLN